MADFVNTLKSSVKSAANALGVSLPGDSTAPDESQIVQEYLKYFKDGKDEVWSVNGQDWYKIFGYQFVIIKHFASATKKVQEGFSAGQFTQKLVDKFNSTKAKKQIEKDLIYTLPIPPQSLVIRPVMANRITPTIGGVVEEVSPVTFWDIAMSGTTGTAVGRENPNSAQDVASKFRNSISTTGLLSGIAAQASSLVNRIGGFADALTGKQSGQSGLIGAINNTLTPPLPYGSSSVNSQSNGFTEIHALEKFFYFYQKLKHAYPEEYSLYFINQKTNQKWRIAVKSFAKQQQANNPNLWRYEIRLQGWDVSAGSFQNLARSEFDRFAAGGDLSSVNTTNVFDTVKKVQAIGKNIFGRR